MKWILVAVCISALLAEVIVGPLPSREPSSTAQAEADGEPITPIPPPPPADPRKLALGERLFGDARLSADGTFACSSCHDLRSNGADGGRGRASGQLDTLTVFNAALSFRLTWEGRYRTLADQAEASIGNPANMRSTVADVVLKLQADSALNKQFRAAYGHDVDRDSLLDAISTLRNPCLRRTAASIDGSRAMHPRFLRLNSKATRPSRCSVAARAIKASMLGATCLPVRVFSVPWLPAGRSGFVCRACAT